jgi:hypothetical protein
MKTTSKGTSARETVLSHIEVDHDFPVTFIYGTLSLAEGLYIVRVGDSEPCVAEYYQSIDTWNQIGIDYDVWQHNSAYANDVIVVHARINLSTCASDTVPANGSEAREPMPESFVLHLADETTAIPIHGESGLKGRTLVTEERAALVEELTAEAESLAQGNSLDQTLFDKFIEWYSLYTEAERQMNPQDYDHMRTSDEYFAFCAGAEHGIAIEQAYQRIPIIDEPAMAVSVSRDDIITWRAEWLESNDPRDDTDVVTPFDKYLYGFTNTSGT